MQNSCSKNVSHGVLTQFSCSKNLLNTCSRSHRVHSHHLVVVYGPSRQSSQFNREWKVDSGEVVTALSLQAEEGQGARTSPKMHCVGLRSVSYPGHSPLDGGSIVSNISGYKISWL